VIKRVRDLAVRCAQLFFERRRELGFPLLSPEERAAYEALHPPVESRS
jgi:hypothetical protein